MMKLVLLYFTCVFFNCFSFVSSAVALEEQLTDHTVSLEFHDESVDEVLRKVALQGRYDLIYDENLSMRKISGKYKNISVVNALRRVYANSSFTLTIDPEQRIIVVKTFGAKKYKVISGTERGGLAALHGISFKNLDILHKEQVEEIEKYLNNPDSVEPITGKSLCEIRRLHESENAEIKANKQDKQLVLLHKNQKNEIDAYRNNPKSVEPITGMTLGEIKTLHKKQHEEIVNKNMVTIDPFTGMTIGEIKKLHEKQSKELRLKRSK